MFKYGVKCLRCQQILFDKSTFNRHHSQRHLKEVMMFEVNVPYKNIDDEVVADFDWQVTPLPKALPTDTASAPGLLERETKILSRAEQLYCGAQYAAVADPSVTLRDEAVLLLDAVDECAWSASASAVTRSQVLFENFIKTVCEHNLQVMRSKNNDLKAVPFQPLKDSSGSAYAVTLARFYSFAKIYFGSDSSLQVLVQQATEEECMGTGVCCLEGFIYCLAVHAPHHKNADALQHAAMHMRRVIRGTALLVMKTFTGIQVEEYCEKFLNPKRAAPFGVLTTLYFEIKRCLQNEKRLMIHRTEQDEDFPPGSAILVSTYDLVQESRRDHTSISTVSFPVIYVAFMT